MPRFYRQVTRTALVGLSLGILPFSLQAKKKHADDIPSQDQIAVVAHLPLTSGTIVSFLNTQHYRRDYLYAEGADKKTLTLIDVTDAAKPSVLATEGLSTGSSNLITAAGTAALVSESNAEPTSATQEELNPKEQTFRIMNFADPLHPVVQQEFTGVTAIGRDDRRGLIFLANSQGLWVLREKLAMDPEFVKEWEHMMLDNR